MGASLVTLGMTAREASKCGMIEIHAALMSMLTFDYVRVRTFHPPFRSQSPSLAFWLLPS